MSSIAARATSATGASMMRRSAFPASLLSRQRRSTTSTLAVAARAPIASAAGAVATSSSLRRLRRSTASSPVVRTRAGDGATAGTITIAVNGMVCDGCSGRVEEALKAAPGVAKASVDLKGAVARVEPAAGAATGLGAALVELVNGLGFEAKLQQKND